ncbi:MAG: TolC family protein [Bacteroidota bacterium]
MKVFFGGLLLLGINSASFAQQSLPAFIDSAIKNSPLIKDNQNQSKANQLEIERLKAQFTKPQIGLTGNFLAAPIISADNNTRLVFNSKGADKYYGYDLGATNGGQYQGLVTITQPIFNQERYKVYGEQADIASQINRNNIKLTEHDVVKFVTDQYILCLLDLQQSDYARDMLGLLQAQRDIVKKLADNALLKQSDYSLINIEYENFKNQFALSNANYWRDLLDLKILAGIRDTSFVALDTLVLTLKDEAPSFTSNYLEKYKLDSLNLQATQKIFETKYRPQLNVFANSGLNAVNFETIPSRFGLSAGLSLTWNIFDGQQKQITRQKTKYLLQSVTAYRDNFLVQNDLRKSKFIQELNSYKERSALLQQQLSEYNSVINSYRKELISGQQSVINFINTIKNMAIVQRDYSLLQTNQLLLINAYNYWNW